MDGQEHELILQLEAALKAATDIGDRTVVYMVDRALRYCLVRWPKPPDSPYED